MTMSCTEGVSQFKNAVKMAGLVGVIFLFFCAPAFSQTDSFDPTLTIEESEKTALEQHPYIKIAVEDVSVAAAKKDEAARALWPAVNLRAEQTHGMANRDLGTPDFVEKSYGVQLSQPLMQGGKLYYTYQQTRSNWRAAKAKEDKTERDILFNVREAYWQVVRSGKVQSVYEAAQADLEKEVAMAERLRSKDVITKETYLMIASNYHQAVLAVESAKAERDAHRWRWSIAMGFQTAPEYEPVSDLIVKTSTISLELCLNLARAYNPDLLIQENTMQASQYGFKASQGNLWPRLGINGFYGKSGGAYTNEVFTYGEDYLIGVQLSQFFAMSTLNLSGFHQQTSPKIGQSSRTEAQTGTASLGLLDGYKTRTEMKDSAFNYHQAETQLQQSELDILADVREAYANWKKGLTQILFAENEAAWKRVEYNVVTIKASHRDLPLSERAKLRNELALAEAALVAAKANYNVLQASLCRVVGVPNLFADQ